MDNVISSETKLKKKYKYTCSVIDFPRSGISKVISQGRIYIIGAVDLSGKSKLS